LGQEAAGEKCAERKANEKAEIAGQDHRPFC
jgi:hypothetical protein